MAGKVEKQQAGFKFGKYQTKVSKTFGEVVENGRTYRLVKLTTSDGLTYISLRLYNQKGKFIKQFMFEPWILNGIIDLFISASK